MARPHKEGMDYFPHDTDAVNDEKIEALRSIYGNDGYAFYFIMLERIYRTANFEIDVSDAETREETMQILARKVSVTLQEFKSMLETAFKWGCFDKVIYEERGVITSQGIKKRADVVVGKRERMRSKYIQDKGIISAAETKQKLGRNAAVFPVSDEFLPTKKRKEKKSKEKKNKIHYAEFVTMTEEEHTKLIDKHSEPFVNRCIEVLNNYKASSGKPYKSDYHAVLTWVVERVENEGGGKCGRIHQSNDRKIAESEFADIDFRKFEYGYKPEQ